LGRCVEGHDLTYGALFSQRLDVWLHADRTVRVIDVLVDELNLRKLVFDRAEPAATGMSA